MVDQADKGSAQTFEALRQSLEKMADKGMWEDLKRLSNMINHARGIRVEEQLK